MVLWGGVFDEGCLHFWPDALVSVDLDMEHREALPVGPGILFWMRVWSTRPLPPYVRGTQSCRNLGINLPVVVVLLFAWDELASRFNYSCSTGFDLIKQKRDRIKLDGNSTETLFVFCSF